MAPICTVVAVMLSTWRPGAIVASAIEAALSAPDVCSVHVWGYEPTGYRVQKVSVKYKYV
jgi:hypothetical protein